MLRRFFSQSLPYPRAAVSVSIARPLKPTPSSRAQYEYLLVQRKNPPGAGTWSLPGGRINLGESVLDAGKREIEEETGIRSDQLHWLSETAGYNDVMFSQNGEQCSTGKSSSSPDKVEDLQFHYVLTQLVAVLPTSALHVTVSPGDDALDFRWATLQALAAGEVEMVGFDVVQHLTNVEKILKRVFFKA